MVFPQTPINVTTQLFYDGQWNTVGNAPKGDGVRYDDGIRIVRGRTDEQSTASPSSATFKLGNLSNTYSPHNPASPLFGKIGPNTPVRVKIPPSGGEQVALSLAGAVDPAPGARVETPDAVHLDTTGDMDVRIDAEPDRWRWETYSYTLASPGAPKFVTLASKWHDTGVGTNQRSWVFAIRYDGYLRFRISTNGAASGQLSYLSTEPVPADAGRLALRVAIDVNNGAGGHDVRFYTADTIAGPWTQLGGTVTTAGTVGIFNSSADLVIGSTHAGQPYAAGTASYTGLLHGFELYDGFGSRVAALNFGGYDTFDRTLLDDEGVTWQLAGAAEFVNTATRHCGEIADWSPDWDRSGTDRWVPVTASGVIRRLRQGDKPVDSPMRKSWTQDYLFPGALPDAYWPCEDEDSATTIASGFEGKPPMKLGIRDGFPIRDTEFAAYNGFYGSKPIAEFGVTTAFGDIVGAQDTGFMQALCLLHLPENGIASDVEILNVATTGTTAEWALVAKASTGHLQLRIYGEGGSLIDSSGIYPYGLNGKNVLAGFQLVQSGANIDWYVIVWEQPDLKAGVALKNVSAGIAPDTLLGHRFGKPIRAYISKLGDADGTAVGHVTVRTTQTSQELATLPIQGIHPGNLTRNAFIGWARETAGYRIIRLCQEHGVPIRFIGDPDATPFLWFQPDGNVVDLLEEAAATDGGILAEAREFLGFEYITREALCNQTPALTLDYAAADFSEVPRPKQDDRYIRNDVTVQRRDGSSRRSVQTSGPLNVSDPRDDPQGVGLYDESVTLSLYNDGQVADQASWRLHLGTVDEERYPSLVVNLARRTGYIDTVLGLQLGQRIAATNMPTWVKPENVSQLLRGYDETIMTFEHRFDFKTTAAGGYDVAVYGSDRAGTLGSELATDVDSDDTTLLVSTTRGYLWTEDPAEFPFDVLLGGEALTVSAIEPCAQDAFGRTVASGWGTPDVGPPWATSGGAAADFAVGSGYGSMTLSTVNVRREALLGVSVADGEIAATIATSQVATGNWITAQLLARRFAVSTYLAAQVEFKHTGIVGIALYEVVGGAATFLYGAEYGSYAAGEQFRVRLRTIGEQVRVKFWRVSAGEASAFYQTTTIPVLAAAGDLGAAAMSTTGNTNANPAVRFDDLIVSSPQRFTVARSVNGVTKSHSAGDAVALRNPAYFGI
ncbi:hypothetical protein [Prauserella muralis]|uniref:Uncharacterized protein n=1 Tax=Prauserella muralis TaxID=588067 RepID=A0A2V4BCU8_9PSEU|nr:hypothetical protein [Prauserella muralis]PXY27439.1 hypothetical protein BAY60_13475 [Prauserella muralis]TWE22860.1 hypothetical protein FHX69_4116 [Prauserella muralis]